MINVLILGHRGMLGRAVMRYLASKPEYRIETTTHRWGTSEFEDHLQATQTDFIVNAIGKIPQKKPSVEEYRSVNEALPAFLETLGTPVIHPSTDCEFSGLIPPGTSYPKDAPRDADDPYGKSKAAISERIEKEFVNTKIIRTSIIGHEERRAAALLDWFLTQNESVRGFTNHYWNGLTTLEWTKQMLQIITDWDAAPRLSQFGTADHYSKYDVLTIAKRIYKKDIHIEPFEHEQTLNKCLASDREMPALPDQLSELRTFFST